jgi:leukotriene-A4 hydrolase
LTRIDGDLNITETVDPECKMNWYPLSITKGYQPAFDAAHTFISSMGRMKYLQPIYQALIDTDNLDMARQWFQENVNFYHPYCVWKLSKMLGLNDQQVNQMKQLQSQQATDLLFLQA